MSTITSSLTEQDTVRYKFTYQNIDCKWCRLVDVCTLKSGSKISCHTIACDNVISQVTYLMTGALIYKKLPKGKSVFCESGSP